MCPRLALVHTVASLAPIFDDLCAELLPGVETDARVDEGLLAETIRTGNVQPATRARLADHVERAAERGADAVLVTCSSLGAVVDELAGRSPIPVFRVDEAMADEAVRLGRRIGVLATLRTTLEPTADLVAARAAAAGRSVEIVAVVAEGAFDALRGADVAGHDARVRAAAIEIAPRVDVIVLAQASMGRALGDGADLGVPVLASPRLGVERLAERLSAPGT